MSWDYQSHKERATSKPNWLMEVRRILRIQPGDALLFEVENPIDLCDNNPKLQKDLEEKLGCPIVFHTSDIRPHVISHS
jgi:hypothetical protein